MSEYIDKAEAIHKMWQNLYTLEDLLERRNGLNVTERLNVQNGFEAGLEAMVNMPTIDIVYCGECKSTGKQIPVRFNSNEPKATKLFCGKLNMYVKTDWFCADGERKDTE